MKREQVEEQVECVLTWALASVACAVAGSLVNWIVYKAVKVWVA